MTVSKKILQTLWKFVKNELMYGYKCTKCHKQGTMNYFCGGSIPIIGFYCYDCRRGWSLEFLRDDKHAKRLQYISLAA